MQKLERRRRTIACMLVALLCCVFVITATDATTREGKLTFTRQGGARQQKDGTAQQDIVGIWQGTLDAGTAQLKLVLEVVKKSDGTMSATLDSPDQGAEDLPVDTITLTNSSVRFELKYISAAYEGKLAGDGSEISGHWKQSGIALPLVFKRADTPKASTPSRPLPQRVDAGGHRLRMLIEGAGTPTVVLESGFGTLLENWNKVQPEVARFAQVVAYDRAGIGQSEAGPKPRTARQLAKELRTALRNANLQPPYVLVGHSAGGIYVRVFAHLYPKEVAGLVLVDPSVEDFTDWLKTHRPEQSKKVAGSSAALPEGLRNESEAWEATIKQARAAWPLPDVPVILLTGLLPNSSWDQEAVQVFLGMHKRLLLRIPNSKHIVTEKSGHLIQVQEPELVIDAIRQVVFQARTRRR